MLIRRKALKRGWRLLNFPLNEIENGIAVPGKFTAFNKNVAIGQIKIKINKYIINKILKKEITHIKKHTDIDIIGSRAT